MQILKDNRRGLFVATFCATNGPEAFWLPRFKIIRIPWSQITLTCLPRCMGRAATLCTQLSSQQIFLGTAKPISIHKKTALPGKDQSWQWLLLITSLLHMEDSSQSLILRMINKINFPTLSTKSKRHTHTHYFKEHFPFHIFKFLSLQ